MMLKPNVTPHAAQRFAERFPDLDINVEFSTAIRKKGLTKRAFNYIKERCHVNGKVYMSDRLFRGVYYKQSTNGVVFVMRPPMEVVTVLKLSEELFRKPAKAQQPWVLVPGTNIEARGIDKLRQPKFRAILKAGNDLYDYVRAHTELNEENGKYMDAWLQAITPDEPKEAPTERTEAKEG